MTEKEWLECTDPELLLESVNSKMSDRKRRLFAAACVRQNWTLLHDERSQSAVIIAERYADESATIDELRTAQGLASQALQSFLDDPSEQRWHYVDIYGADAVLQLCNENLRGDYMFGAITRSLHSALASQIGQGNIRPLPGEQRAMQAAYLHDVTGNPFRPGTIDPRWLTADVTDLARAIYEDRAFDRMPILADALTDAGCDNPDIIAHCRCDGPHVRGCWVVDLLLGKE